MEENLQLPLDTDYQQYAEFTGNAIAIMLINEINNKVDNMRTNITNNEAPQERDESSEFSTP